MLRRSHKKSRAGCLECKRRHVKCDEVRPACLLCTMSGRDCSFASQATPDTLSTVGRSSQERSRSPGDSHSQDGVTLPDVTRLTVNNTELPERPAGDNDPDSTLDEAVNLNHMELLVHLTLDRELFNLGIGAEAYPYGLLFGLKTGIDAPYLIHQMLAFSACRLAFLRPERSHFYLHQSVSLQTRAISLFNASYTGVNRTNCVAIMLFSAILGHHLQAERLGFREGGLDAFLSHYTHYLETQRGIYTIYKTALPLLMESELEPVLTLSANFTSRSPVGNHCQRIRELVDSADGLRKEEKEACRLAIQYLQVGFDALTTEDEIPLHRHQMVFTWTMLVPPEFTDLLGAKRPEGLVLLGYYALLLHCGRNMWQVRDAGTYIFGLIVDHLGPEWDHWLEYPRAMIANDSS